MNHSNNDDSADNQAKEEEESTTKPPRPKTQKIQRSRTGCSNCKKKKIRCSETRPSCENCIKTNSECDYSLKLTWGGRPYKDLLKRKEKYSVSQIKVKNENKSKRKKDIQFVVSDLSKNLSQASTPMSSLSSIQSIDRREKRKLTDTPESVSMDESSSLLSNSSSGSNKKRAMLSVGDFTPITDLALANQFEQFENGFLSPAFPIVEDDHEPEFNNSELSISDGIESLSNALDRISNGTHELNLQNSDIFNNLVMHNDKIKIEEFDKIDPFDEIGDSNQNFDNYSEDLAKIESFFPKHPKLVSESLSSSSSPKTITYDNELALDEENSPYYDFSLIPPPLTPLPDYLLRIPLYRSLMHFWVEVFSNNLVPAPSNIYEDNPFKVLLPQMAMQIPSLLLILLTFAAKARTTLGENANYIPKELIDQLLSRACNELLKCLKNKDEAKSDGTLATVLLFSAYEIFFAESMERHRAHTTGARQIIRARNKEELAESSHLNVGVVPSRNEGDVSFFLMRWFLYVDVIGSLSTAKISSEPLYYDSETPLKTFDSKVEESDQDPKKDIDYLLGFDVNLFPKFAEISILIRKSENYNSDLIPVTLVTDALNLKENFTKAFEEGEARRQAELDLIFKKKYATSKDLNITNLIQQDKILRCTNKIFCDMGILNLYRRVLKIPRNSSLIQDLANGIGYILETTIPSLSSAEICTIFCLFCAGCETLDSSKRDLFFDRFTRLARSGSVSAKKGLQIMTRCWDTGEDWITSARALDIDIILL